MRKVTFKIKGTQHVFATSYQRVVMGGQGPYIEFSVDDILAELEITKGQEFRYLARYSRCKYYWLNPIGHPTVKVYQQKGLVSYADYKVGMYYISPDQLDWDVDVLHAEYGYKPGEATPMTFQRGNK